MSSNTCHFASKSNLKCMNLSPYQTLDALDRASMKIPGKHMKISWLILSRVGIHYLSSTFGSWTICQIHRKEFLDTWQVPAKCTHPDHNIMNDQIPCHLVTMVMSVKLLQSEGKVVPISSKFCSSCFEAYTAKYSSKPGEKLVVVVPKPKPNPSPFQVQVQIPPPNPSPFEPIPEKSNTSNNVPLNIGSRGVLATSEVPNPPELNITIKTELVFENNANQIDQNKSAGPTKIDQNKSRGPTKIDQSKSGGLTKNNRKRSVTKKVIEAESEVEDELDSLLDHDSDDDPSWAPGAGNVAKPSPTKESELFLNFQPKKRKRIGPDEVMKKPKKLPPVKFRRKNSSNSDSEDEDDTETDSDIMDMSEEANRIEGAGGTDFHYFCKICQISFFKYTAFKHHVMNSVDLHKKLKKQEKKKKESEMEYECSDCCIAFQDRKSHQAHMIEEHSDSVENPFYCQKCNVYLKSESAFKSHNSKLHLERREKSYYCRECDETFSCLIKHSLHIVIHRTWTQEEMGMQCRICGKVFSRNQTLPFHRHLATHDTEPETECSCSNCTGKEPLKTTTTTKPEKDPLEVKTTRRSANKPPPRGNLFKKMQSVFNDDDDDEDDDEESDDEDTIKPFECGVCSKKFSTVSKLEKCVANCNDHKEPVKPKSNPPPKLNEPITAEVIDEIADEFANEVANIEAKSAKKSAKKSNSAAKNTNSNGERNWQECPDRNWAAEFGYGGGATSVGPTKDILSKMAKSFKLLGGDDDDDDDEENDDENHATKENKKKNSNSAFEAENELFRTRGFKGTVKASLNRAPRTLSSSSLRTRKRMEALMRRAREFMKKDKKKSEKVTKNGNDENKPKIVKEKPQEIEKVVQDEGTEPEPPVHVHGEPVEPIVTEVDVPIVWNNSDIVIEKTKEIEKVVEDEVTEPEPPVQVQAEPVVAEVVVPIVVKIPKVAKVQYEVEAEDVEEEEEEEDDSDDEFDGISDEDEDDTDGLLIPLENGWVCEKRLSDPKSNAYSTHFWSPDGHRHSSLSAIKSYGTKKKLKLNLVIFERALKNNPHK